MKRIAVIGVGLITAGGDTLRETWDFLQSGQRAHQIEYGRGERCRLERLAYVAIEGALESAGLRQVDALCLGSTSASFSEVERGRPLIPRYLSRVLAQTYGIDKRFQTSQACASSSYAVAMGADLIRHGQAKVVLAGGADELTKCVAAAFGAVRLTADECLPFGAERRGVVLSEAAAFMVLAEAGIGKPICYLGDAGLTCDAHDSVAPTITGIASAIVQAMETAYTARTEGIDFVVAHGTGTKVGDLTESKAIRRAFEELHITASVPVSSYKGAIGHPQGASGAVGLVLAAEALRTQTVFPTLTGEIDPAIEIRVATVPIWQRIERVLCLSYGSWGVNSALVLEKA